MTKLVFVWIGDQIPDWAEIALSINANTSGKELLLIKNRNARYHGDVDTLNIEDFYTEKKSCEDDFRNGFWKKTTERFYVLQAYMYSYNIDNIFHAELDNIVFDISDLDCKLDKTGTGLFCPRDSDYRGIASLIYINDLKTLNLLCSEGLGVKKNDMELLGYCLDNHSKKFHSLPTDRTLDEEINKKNYYIDNDYIGGIFDAAAIGQYLFGVDPRNIIGPLYNGFINENASKNIKNFNFSLNIAKKKFYIIMDGKYKNIYNVHVHSKIFEIFLSENNVEKIINNIKFDKKTLIKLNLYNSLLRFFELIKIFRYKLNA